MTATRRNTLFAAIGTAFLVGCATAPPSAPLNSRPTHVAAFSTSQLGEPHPLEWQPWIMSRFNRRTDYRIVEIDGKRVLRAQSEKAASGILQEVAIDPLRTPHLSWRWKISQLLAGADLTRRGSDDSPVRVIVSFDGDLEKLDVEERANAGMVKLLSGREMPYATLMYVWDNQLATGTFIDNAHSARAKMIVVESGAKRAGQWLPFSRNIVADFKRAFGEPPGKIISVGVMTDSNSTETDALAYYGDIALTEHP